MKDRNRNNAVAVVTTLRTAPTGARSPAGK